MRWLIAAVAVIAAATVIAPTAMSLPPCNALSCHPSGTWFWNKQSAEYQLILVGIEVQGHHFEITSATCYGLGNHMWGAKGPEYQRFHCSADLSDNTGNSYSPYGLTFYVQGHYAWTWGK